MTWTTLASFLGAVAGALITSWGHYWKERVSERSERRKEHVTCLTAFLTAVQEAERVAVDRWHHRMTDEPYQERERKAVDRMWVTQKTLHMLCTDEINQAAREVCFAVQNVIRNGPDDCGEPQDERVWACISPRRKAFLDIVKRHLQPEG